MSITKPIQLGMFILGLSALGQHAAGTEPPISAFAGLEALLPETPSSDLGSHAGQATLIVIFADTPERAERNIAGYPQAETHAGPLCE